MSAGVETVTELYKYLEGIMPIKRILISLGVGMVTLFIVLVSGLTSDFVREETVADRTFSAFSFATLLSFILMMGGEEYAIFKTDQELENFIESAQIAETGEDFNREEYLRVEEDEDTPDVADESELAEEPTQELQGANAFQPMNFNNFSNQH